MPPKVLIARNCLLKWGMPSMDRDFSPFPLSPPQIYNVNRQAGESRLSQASCCVRRRRRRPPAPFVDLWRPRLFACPLYGHWDGIRLRISLLSLQLKSFSFIYLFLFCGRCSLLLVWWRGSNSGSNMGWRTAACRHEGQRRVGERFIGWQNLHVYMCSDVFSHFLFHSLVL